LKIKAQGLLNAVKWIEETYGQAALRDVIRACSPAVRERYTSAIAIEWHPVEEFVEFLEVTEKVLGNRDGKLAEEIGAAGARANLRGAMLRIVFYVARPEFLMRRVAQLWRQFNDEGEMLITHFGDYSSGIEVRGLATSHWLFCCTLTGWAREVTYASGGVRTTVKHVECRAKGGARCIWDIHWSGITAGQVAENERRRGASAKSSGSPAGSEPPGNTGAPSSLPPSRGRGK
jgi:hypothetical protein